MWLLAGQAVSEQRERKERREERGREREEEGDKRETVDRGEGGSRGIRIVGVT